MQGFRQQAREGYSFYATTESWSPSFERGDEDIPPGMRRNGEGYDDWLVGGLVACCFFLPNRVVFGGMDDTGMEQTFSDEAAARRFVCHLPSVITFDWLLSAGFRWV